MKINVLKIKLRKLHKYIGFTFSIFIIYLTITGILLTYPEIFKIKDTYVSNYFILKKYNMETHKDVYQLKNNNEIIFVKNNIYINKNFVDKIKYKILGIIYDSTTNLLYVLDNNFLNIYILEKINNELEINNIIILENNDNLINLGFEINTDTLVLKSIKGAYKLTDNIITNHKMNRDFNYEWSRIKLANKKTANKYLLLHQGEGVSLSRIITELHNGKFFGSIFTLILFISSISLIFLTLSSFIFATNFFNKRKRN